MPAGCRQLWGGGTLRRGRWRPVGLSGAATAAALGPPMRWGGGGAGVLCGGDGGGPGAAACPRVTGPVRLAERRRRAGPQPPAARAGARERRRAAACAPAGLSAERPSLRSAGGAGGGVSARSLTRARFPLTELLTLPTGTGLWRDLNFCRCQILIVSWLLQSVPFSCGSSWGYDAVCLATAYGNCPCDRDSLKQEKHVGLMCHQVGSQQNLQMAFKGINCNEGFRALNYYFLFFLVL